ncbi:MAG: porin family protein [Bacteroidales bacterium]|nr:porin family protein [Bacteroidales bacterium]
MPRFPRFLLVALFLCVLLPSGAQRRVLQHRPYVDVRRFHYGFQLGFHDQALKLINRGNIGPEGQQWVSENDFQNFGFSVGVLAAWRLSPYMQLRLSPTLHFGSKHFTLREQSSGQQLTQELRSSYIALPLHLKVNAPRFNNYRPYVLTGMSLMVDLNTGKGLPLRTHAFQPTLDIGLGCEFYLPYFKACPELRFSFGFLDAFMHERPDLTEPSQLIHTQSIGRATPSMVTLLLHIE